MNILKKIIPRQIVSKLRPAYHFSLSLVGSILYRFPSKRINVVGVTGTKGKTTTSELLAALLEEAGRSVALTSTLKFKLGKSEERNIMKMSMPGRFFMQHFLRKAVSAGCDYAVLEMTSEGAKQYRHKFIHLNSLIFTNLSPEHIESHGSYENYRDAKLQFLTLLDESSKKNKVSIANTDDKEGYRFLATEKASTLSFSLDNLDSYEILERGIRFSYKGNTFFSHLSGKFNLYNILAMITFAESQNISLSIVEKTLEKFYGVRGRMESVRLADRTLSEKQNFDVYVDYAHTPDSLTQVYEFLKEKNTVCILGNTGGGRDKWKRREMASIADKYCDHIILTNEDPYDEDPMEIIEQMQAGVADTEVETILDRREAINKALTIVPENGVVIITGKGTDPFIMEANGTKTPWDDADVVREELAKTLPER